MEESVITYLTNQFYESEIKKNSIYSSEIAKLNEGELEIYISRQKELTQLEILIETIYKNNESGFSTKDEILNLFIEAQVNGRILKLGKVIEKSLGPGSLKTIDYRAM